MIARLKTDAEKGFEAFETQDAAAYAAFEANGLPHRRVEEYKYTDLRVLIKEAKPLVTTLPVLPAGLAIGLKKLVFAGGAYVPHLSDELPEGAVIFTPLEPYAINGIGEHDPIIGMNSAFIDVNYSLTIAPDADLSLALVHLGVAETSSFTRLYIYVSEGAKLTLTEFEAGDNLQSNVVLQVNLSENAKLDHYRLQKSEGSQAFHTMVAETDTKSELRSFTLNEGVALTRNQYFVSQKGHDCKLNLAGVALQNGKLLADTTLQVRHEGLRGESREMFKYVLSNGAKGVFQGKIIVDKEAQKTDGKMSSNCIMLDDTCDMMNKPELEIYADDVLCGHGATCGELDDDLMFYMLARGIDPVTAKNLLIQAFVGEAVELIENEEIKLLISARIEDILAL